MMLLQPSPDQNLGARIVEVVRRLLHYIRVKCSRGDQPGSPHLLGKYNPSQQSLASCIGPLLAPSVNNTPTSKSELEDDIAVCLRLTLTYAAQEIRRLLLN